MLRTFLLEHELIYELIQVGRWPPRPVLPTLKWTIKICEVIYLEVLGVGGRGAEATVLLEGCIRLDKILSFLCIVLFMITYRLLRFLL